jgi:4-hydroxythreonine-4-phosphate dehydrogenase
MAEPLKIGITQGDINSIAYEVIIKTLMDTRMLDVCTSVVYGSSKVAVYHRKNIGAESFSFNIVRTVDECNPRRANIINVMDDSAIVEMGKPTTISGHGAMQSLTAAIKDLNSGKIDAIVTSPFDKHNMAASGFKYAGHTDFLANTFKSEALMLLIHSKLRIGTASGHIALRDVPQKLNKELILQKLTLLKQSLTIDFGVHKPRIAVLGLNPHAGDNGLLGAEEEEIIIPAMAEGAKQNMMLYGPYAADGFFVNQYRNYDGILAMYHDQGLAAFKALSLGEGVNFTAGLPIVRTSPAHGTAFDIAGKNVANPESFRNAIYNACDIVKKRREYEKMSANILKSPEPHNNVI